MLSHANSFSISFVSIFRNFITQFFSTTIFWVHVRVVDRTRQTSPLLHLNGFKTKFKLKWIFQSKERHKTVNRKSWHYWNNLNISESFILLLIETEFLASKSCNSLWKKSMHEYMWLIISVVPTCNNLFDYFLTFWLWKLLTCLKKL